MQIANEPIRLAVAKGGGEMPAHCPLCSSSHIVPFLTAPDRFHGRKRPYFLKRCEACGGVWLAEPPAPEQLWEHYGEDYHRTIGKAGESSGRWRRHRETILRQKAPGAILDIGCSSGAFLRVMKDRDWRLYGVEMNPTMAEKARAATGASVFVGDVADAHFAKEAFDVVTCFDVLEHMYDPRQFLSSVHQWLRPGGILYLVLPNIDSWESRVLGSYWYGLELPRHLFHFSPVSLRKLMATLGFDEKYLAARTSYVERSAAYLRAALLESVGGHPTPLSLSRRAGLPSRIIRKALRTVLVHPFAWIASEAGAGASMEAMFSKVSSDRDSITTAAPF